MGTGCCRRCGVRPRRVRRGTLEPLCEECYREAMDKVARELAKDATGEGRERVRKAKFVASDGAADTAPEQVVPVVRAGGRPPDGDAQGRQTTRNRQAAVARLRCISEELLVDARWLYDRGLSMRRVAEALLDQTGYANAHSAEVALRFQFMRRGWPQRSRAQARRARHTPGHDDLPRAA